MIFLKIFLTEMVGISSGAATYAALFVESDMPSAMYSCLAI